MKTMFNKALFKQSMKANGLMWLIITIASCFMLSCVMLISGSGKIGEVAEGVEDTIITETIDATVKNSSAVNYTYVSDATKIFDETFASEIKSNFLTEFAKSSKTTPEEKASEAYTLTCTVDAPSVYANSLSSYKVSLEAYTKSIDESYDQNSDTYKNIYEASLFVMNPNGSLNSKYEEMEEGSSEKVKDGYDVASLFTIGQKDITNWLTTGESTNLNEYINGDERTSYRDDLAIYALPISISHSFNSEESINKLLDALEEYGIDREKYDSYGYSYDKVKDLSASSIVTFKARYELELSKMSVSDYETIAQYQEAVSEMKQSLIKEISSSSIDMLPNDVRDALEEIGKMDLYSIIVGSIFFKMAGLLLPIIYIIMASNNLIASQVDTGSMAYVLSTSIKREEVTCTQALYLVLSLLAMFVCTSITSLICFSIVNVSSSLTYGKLLLMNLGAFLVLFAMSGINFFTSCSFDQSKKSMSLGGGLSMFFLVCTILGLFGSPVIPAVVRLDALNFFNYVSIITLFDTISIIDGTLTFIYKLVILAVIGIVGYIAGSFIFKKKDLPL